MAKHQIKEQKNMIESEPLANQIKTFKTKISHVVTDVIYILIGIISAGFGLKGFL